MKALLLWLQNRIGWQGLRETLLDRKIPRPGRWGWFYTLGSATLLVFLIQVATGMLLGMNYSPSPDHAYASIQHIMTEMPMGAFLRGLHKWGASAMIVLLLLHLVRIFIMGSYKSPRELTWILGVFLLLLVFGLGFTGYLLPWDQKAYWATAVGINIAEEAPGLGPMIAKTLKGGEELGALTLSRFYAFHVLVLPTLVALLLALHLYLVISHGISNPPHPRGKPAPDYKTLKAAGESFHPGSTFKDVVMALVVVAVLFGLAYFVGADLEDPADPNDSSYNPRPEWYFLFLFQMLKLFPGSLESLAAVVFPTIIVLLLLALPWLDRGDKRHPLARPFLVGSGMIALGIAGWLTVQGWRSPLLNPQIEKDPFVLQGRALYQNLHCGYCHKLRGEGGNVGPDLSLTVSLRSDEWLDEHFRKPSSVSAGSAMPEMHLLDEEIQSLIAYLRDVGGGGASSTEALKLYTEHCSGCHTLGGKGNEVGPDLTHIGRFRETTWLKAYLENPPALYPDSIMPAFGESLTLHEIETLARYLAAQK